MCLRQFVMIVTTKWVTVLLKRFPEFLWWNTSVSSHLLVYLCSISSVEIRLPGYYCFLSNWWHWSTIHYKKNCHTLLFFYFIYLKPICFYTKPQMSSVSCGSMKSVEFGDWLRLSNIWRDQKLVWQLDRFKATRFLPVLPARYAMIKVFDRAYFE